MARNFWKEKAKYKKFYASDVKLDLFAQTGLKLLKSLKDLSMCFIALLFFYLQTAMIFYFLYALSILTRGRQVRGLGKLRCNC